MIVCGLCGHECVSQQSYSKHYPTCSSRHEARNIQQKKRKINDDDSVFVLPTSEVAFPHFRPSTSIEHSEATDDLNNNHLLLNENFEHFGSAIRNNNDIKASLTQEQKLLIDQDQQHNQRNKSVKYLWCTKELEKLELLKLLQKHNCHNTAYKDILQWHNHYKEDIHTSSSSLSSSAPMIGNDNLKRSNIIAKMEQKFDMKGMKPRIEKLSLSDNDFVDVTVFDFKQQLLSILRDKELMNPMNLVIDEMLQMRDGITSQHISDLHHGEWYRCATEHYNTLHGNDHDRLVCGIILTIDKTHTDWKGKLCLEPVQFSLSIFDKEVRKRNSNCWRCLGYINDMEAYNMKKIHTNTSVNVDIIQDTIEYETRMRTPVNVSKEN